MSGIKLIGKAIADHGCELTFETPSGIYTYKLNRMAAELLSDMARYKPGKALSIAKTVADSVSKVDGKNLQSP